MKWRRAARAVIAVLAVALVVVVALAVKRRAPASDASGARRTDPGAVVESTGGRVQRFKLSREDVRVDYDKNLTYADGSTKLVGITITTDNRAGGRSFIIKAKEADLGQNESTCGSPRRMAPSSPPSTRRTPTRTASFKRPDR